MGLIAMSERDLQRIEVLSKVVDGRMNKRLSDVLAYIKERQDQLPSPKVKTNSEKNGYTPRGRKPGRRTDFINDPAVIAPRQQALSNLDAAE